MQSELSHLIAASLSGFGQLTAIGGPVTWLLLAMSVFAVTIIVSKAIQLYRARVTDMSTVSEALRLWCSEREGQALDAISNPRLPLAQVVWVTMHGLRSPGIEQAAVREEVGRIARLRVDDLRSHLRTLELIGMLAPLLGLLGTVMGMVEAFQQLEAAGNQVSPSILSGGIWQALVTTAFGLAVAIPVVFAHAWLDRKVERCALLMESAATQVFTRKLQVAGSSQRNTITGIDHAA